MGSIIGFLMTTIIMFLVILGGMAGLIYKYRGEKLPYKSRIQSVFSEVTLGDTSLADTLLTEEQMRFLQDMARREKLDSRESDINVQEMALQVRLDSLKDIQEDIQRLAAQREQLQDERLAKLASLYESMRPEVAAPIMQELPDITIAALFTRMNDRQAARIMGAMPSEKAAEIARRMGQVQ